MPESEGTPAFGRYRDPVMLGSGGMGAVYRATDPSLNRYVAIKVLTHRDPRYVERFRREAQVLAKIGHPSIIQIYEIVGSGEDTSDPYIVMEYFEGRPLDALLRQGPLAPAQVVSVVRQCAEGLRKAHANHVIHRDIKPGNVMLSPSGEVKILDFGIAKLRDAKQDLTGEAVLGTPYYMSPEQATGYAIDARSDIYSLGITAFHLLAGRKPFEAKAKVDVMLMQVKAPLPDLTELVPCDERIARIVGKMCAKKPAERYQSCDELIADLDALPRSLGGRAGEAVGTPAIEKTRSLATPVKPAQTSAPRPRPPRMAVRPPLKAPSTRPWTGIAAGAAAAAAVRADFSAADPIHGRCYFPRAVGENRTGQIWEELWIDGRKRAHLIFDPPLPPDDDQLALQLSGRHAARLRELSSGKHTLDVWIYRQAGDGDTPVPLAAGELVVRK